MKFAKPFSVLAIALAIASHHLVSAEIDDPYGSDPYGPVSPPPEYPKWQGTGTVADPFQFMFLDEALNTGYGIEIRHQHAPDQVEVVDGLKKTVSATGVQLERTYQIKPSTARANAWVKTDWAGGQHTFTHTVTYRKDLTHPQWTRTEEELHDVQDVFVNIPRFQQIHDEWYKANTLVKWSMSIRMDKSIGKSDVTVTRHIIQDVPAPFEQLFDDTTFNVFIAHTAADFWSLKCTSSLLGEPIPNPVFGPEYPSVKREGSWSGGSSGGGSGAGPYFSSFRDSGHVIPSDSNYINHWFWDVRSAFELDNFMEDNFLADPYSHGFHPWPDDYLTHEAPNQ